MKTEKAVVEKIESDSALLRIKPENPQDCESCGCCKAIGTQQHLVRLSFSDNPLLTDLKQGDIVTLEIALPNQALAAALLFGLPLGNMVLFGILGRFIFPENEIALVAGGVLGLIIGGLDVMVLNRLMPALKKGIKVISVDNK